MVDTAHPNAEAHWHDEQSNYVGLVLGMLIAKGVPAGMHKKALDDVLLAGWASLRLDLIPAATDLPRFYQQDDPLRASVHNWFLLLVEAWTCSHVHSAPPPRSGQAAAAAHGLLQFVEQLSVEARAKLRRSAGLMAVN